MPASKKLPPPFDFERLTRFMAYGFMMSPVQYHWFSFLSRAFPLPKTGGIVPAFKRVALDQLMFAPFGMSEFTKVILNLHLLTHNRSCLLLHIHDSRRRRRPKSGIPKIPGRLPPCPQSKLDALACSTNSQLQSRSSTIPDCKSLLDAI